MKDYAKMHDKFVARTSKQELTIYLVILLLLIGEALVDKFA